MEGGIQLEGDTVGSLGTILGLPFPAREHECPGLHVSLC